MNNITTLGDENTSICPLGQSLAFIQCAHPFPPPKQGYAVSIAEEEEYVTEFLGNLEIIKCKELLNTLA